MLLEHPAVKDAGVFGEPDPLREEIVVANVVPAEGHTVSPEALTRYCLVHLSRFKVPRRISIVTSLPQTKNGKLDRGKLREEALQLTLRPNASLHTSSSS